MSNRYLNGKRRPNMRITMHPTMKIAAVSITAALTLAGCSNAAQDDLSKAADNVESAAKTASSNASTEASKAAEAVSSQASKASDAAKQAATKATLADWDGTWVSLATYVDDPDLAPAFEHEAQEHGESVDALQAELRDKYAAPVEGLVINEDEITFVTKRADVDNPTEQPVKYVFDDAIEDSHGAKTFTWFVFKAEGDAPYPYVFLLPRHGEETLEHFHARFGSDKDALKNADNFPTFVDPQRATAAQLEEELVHHGH
ncbi:ZinT/AdcA family metal-binding protein [Corynebacterium choanae]|uniref:ZinT/AdcA family metal-binding protein n=1 Tax=Corynebacterium choanae TaxID=1862358 RepID=UPI0013DE0FBF|nr:ZinT/AdcA family metal-binding protein [Corynebacterium choanae]